MALPMILRHRLHPVVDSLGPPPDQSPDAGVQTTDDEIGVRTPLLNGTRNLRERRQRIPPSESRNGGRHKCVVRHLSALHGSANAFEQGLIAKGSHVILFRRRDRLFKSPHRRI